MKKKISMMVAPAGMQPSKYIATAYSKQTEPSTPVVSLQTAQKQDHWQIALSWDCPQKSDAKITDPDQFVDAAAILVPQTPDAAWITMGAPGTGVEGVMWRADSEELTKIEAEGLGSVARLSPHPDWQVRATWKAGVWHVIFDGSWPALSALPQIGIAIWRGVEQQRAGIKSVSTEWIQL